MGKIILIHVKNGKAFKRIFVCSECGQQSDKPSVYHPECREYTKIKWIRIYERKQKYHGIFSRSKKI